LRLSVFGGRLMKIECEVKAHLDAIEWFGRHDEFVEGYMAALRWVLEKREQK